MLNINDFLMKAISLEASDVHLRVGEPPLIRKNGMIVKTMLPLVTAEDMENVFKKITPDKYKSEYSTITDLDYIYEIPKVSRFRVNYGRQRNMPSFVFRIIPLKAKTLEELDFPELINQILRVKSGLIFVTGPAGSGKSTTVAAILDWFNKNCQKHILTIESPIEYIIKSDKSLISQREIGIDTPSSFEGMKYAIHQDPDAIFLGEISDKETAKLVLKAASMGYLVIAALHTPDVVQTIINLVNMFDKNDREIVRHELAENIKGTISQKLVYSEKLQRRFAATEVVFVTPTLQDCIRKDAIEEIYQLMNANNPNIVSLNDSLLKLVLEGKISKEDALSYSNLPDELGRCFRREFYAKKMEEEKQKEQERIEEEQRLHEEEELKKEAEAKKEEEEAAKKAEEEEKKASEEKAKQEELFKQQEIENDDFVSQNDNFMPQNSDFDTYQQNNFDNFDFLPKSSNSNNDGFEPMNF